MPRITRPTLGTIFDAEESNGVGTAINVEDLRHLVVQVVAAASSTLTYKFQVSYSDTVPDFSAAQTAANHWDYVEVIDLQDGSNIDGDTGVALSTVSVADSARNFELNTNHAKWVNMEISSRSAGSLTAKVTGAND